MPQLYGDGNFGGFAQPDLFATCNAGANQDFHVDSFVAGSGDGAVVGIGCEGAPHDAFGIAWEHFAAGDEDGSGYVVISK